MENNDVQNTNDAENIELNNIDTESDGDVTAPPQTADVREDIVSGAVEDVAGIKPCPSHAKKSSFISSVFDIFEMFAICTAVILIVFSFVLRLTVVDGPSMEDTLVGGDYLIVQQLGYTAHRGDIVVLQKYDSPYSDPLVKRIIAVGGDTVRVDYKTQQVYVNGELLDEPYANLEDPTLIDYTLETTIEPGKVFVMGDHRNYSADSRLSEIGQIDESCIIGRAVFRIFPFSKISTLPRAEYEELESK